MLLLVFSFFSEILDSAVEGFSQVMPIKVLSFSVLISTSAPLRRIRWSVYSTVKKKDRYQVRKRKATLICCFVIYLLYIVFLKCPTPTINVIIQNDFAFLILFISINSDKMGRSWLILVTTGCGVLFSSRCTF